MFFDDGYNYYRSPYGRPSFARFGSPYGVDPYQSMVEEAMRRRELERYQAMRQREEMRRQEEEEEYLREQRRKEMLRKAQHKKRSPQYSIVRGPDGRLYRIRADNDDEDELGVESNEGSYEGISAGNEPKQSSFVRGPDGNIYLYPSGYKPQQRQKPRQKMHYEQEQHISESSRPNSTLENPPKRSTGNSVNVLGRTKNEYASNGVDLEKDSAISKVNLQATEKTKKSKKGRRQKITVIVEDASDSENEDDELNSTWRNRRPGPGQSWMEPVDF